MVQRTQVANATLYAIDETAWLEAAADLVRCGRTEDVDPDCLVEYLTDMARRDRREVESRLIVLLAHVLKWFHQPENRSGSWRATVVEQRQELESLVHSGVLWNHAETVLPEVYQKAVERCAAETGLAAKDFPPTCAYSLDDLLSPDIFSEDA